MILKFLYEHGFKEFIDYEIIGEYYDSKDGVVYEKKYNKRYFLRKRRNRAHKQ